MEHSKAYSALPPYSTGSTAHIESHELQPATALDQDNFQFHDSPPKSRSWTHTSCCHGQHRLVFSGKNVKISRAPTCCLTPCAGCETTTPFRLDSVAYMGTTSSKHLYLGLFYLILMSACIGLSFAFVVHDPYMYDYIAVAITLWTLSGFFGLLSIVYFGFASRCQAFVWVYSLHRNCCCSPLHFQIKTGVFGERHTVMLPHNTSEVINTFEELINL